MLYADKRALETNLKVNLLAIREKELKYARASIRSEPTPIISRRSHAPIRAPEYFSRSRTAHSARAPLSLRSYYSQNCLAVGTQAALLAGFAYSGLTQVAIPLDSEYVLKLLYLLVTSAAMCLELIAVMSTTLLSMMGPGLALRGPDGSMHPAVDGMMEEYRSAYLNFLLGLIAFHFSAALFGWLTFNWVVSTFTSSCVLGSLYLLIRYAMRVHSRFRLPAGEVITGRFTGDEVFANMTGRAPVRALSPPTAHTPRSRALTRLVGSPRAASEQAVAARPRGAPDGGVAGIISKEQVQLAQMSQE